MIDVVNKNGESMLNKIADDVWNDKWDMENTRLAREAGKIFEFKDGKLVAKKKWGGGPGGPAFEVGDVIKPTDFPSSMYFVGLFIAMKMANVEKPNKITVNIKNAKVVFDKIKIARGESVAVPSPSEPPVREPPAISEAEPETVLSEVEKAERDAAVRAGNTV